MDRLLHSVAPDGPNESATRSGSDIYLVRAGAVPILVAGQGGVDAAWNLCPVFSPDGRRLAFSAGTIDGQDLVSVIVVDGIDTNGVSSDVARISVPGSGPVVCPRWSSDGTRVAYLEGGVVVVRGSDGSTLRSVAGDPTIDDFSAPSLPNGAILSPAGDRLAWINIGGGPWIGYLEVASRDGADPRVIVLGETPYAITAWSPDGRQVLLMTDVDGANFSMGAVALDSPFRVTTIVSKVAVNNARAWPGWGDVSWQAVLPPAGLGNPSEMPTSSSASESPRAGSWTVTANMVRGNTGHTATLLPDGTVLVAGGIGPEDRVPGYKVTAELYDPRTRTWTATANLITDRVGHTATLLPDGKVLVAGGDDFGLGAMASAELYDPVRGTWSATGNMLTPRSMHTATLLPDGKVLVTGGYDNTPTGDRAHSPEILATAELYDPASGTWSATGNMLMPRRDQSATLLPRWQCAGGGRRYQRRRCQRRPWAVVLASAELYDPNTGTWAAGRRGSHNGWSSARICGRCRSRHRASGTAAFKGRRNSKPGADVRSNTDGCANGRTNRRVAVADRDAAANIRRCRSQCRRLLRRRSWEHRVHQCGAFELHDARRLDLG